MLKPLLCILMVLIVACLCAQVDTQQIELEIFALTNFQRTSAGLNPLYQERGLADLALHQSKNMFRQNFFEHIDKEGLDVSGRQKRYYPEILVTTIGENLFKIINTRRIFTAAEIVQGWMDSPGHKANILNPNYTHVGIGVYQRGDRLYATQVFAAPVVKLLQRLPISTHDFRYRLDFEYLSIKNSEGFRSTIIYPDSSVRFWINEKEYIPGTEIQAPKWRGGRRFSIELDFPAGDGNYLIRFGWGDACYNEGYTIKKK